MSGHFVYATRSILPSSFANSVQSANMACAFSRIQENFAAAFRVPAKHRQRLDDVFADLALTPPQNLCLLPSHPRIDWAEPYLPGFVSFLRRQSSDASVYTRSGRLAWISSAMGFATTIELHDPLKPALTAWLRRRQKREAPGKFVATTHRMKEDLVAEIGVDPDRIFVAGGGANAAFLDLPAAPLRSPYSFNVGYAGSAFKGKGLEILVACAARLPTIGFHVIGPSLKDCRRHGPVGSNVLVHGRKSNIDTISILKSMDCLLLPNQRSVIIKNGADIGAYTSPLKMFEYMATSRPIIASDLPVLTCVLKDNENALLCPPASPSDFCEKILLLRDDPEMAGRLGIRSAKDFQHDYTWEARAKNILAFVES